MKKVKLEGLPVLVLALVLGGLFSSACAEPGPLYGSWSDNNGNTLTFSDDNSFNAKIGDENYSGTFTLLLNALTLKVAEPESTIVTEWDIRGNILYLDWADPEGATLALTLFKVSS